MTTLKKIIANRANAQHSTGPRSPEGKRTSSANAVTHGLFGKNTPVREEDRPVFLDFSQKVYADLQPQWPTEQFYVDLFIDQCWRLRGCLKLETDLFEWYRTYQGTKGDVGVAFAHDASQLNCFGRLSRYAPRFERGLAKDLADLRKLQVRHSQPADQAQPPVGQVPAERELKLSQEKTLMTHLTEGFSFLGQKVRQYGQKLLVKPTSVRREQENAGHAEGGSAKSPEPLGIFSDQVVLSDEDPNQFRAYCQSLLAEWQPRGATRTVFVELFAVNSWRLARLSRVEAGLYEQYRYHDNADGGALTAFVQDACQVDCFGKLADYESPLRNSLSRILKQLLA